MSMLAVPPSDQVAALWSYHFIMLNTAYLIEPKPPHSLLKWENLINALAALPRYLVRKQLFTEMHMDFGFEGQEVGRATLSRRVVRDDLLRLPANISTS